MQFPGNLGERKKAGTGRLGNLDSSPNSVQSTHRAETGIFLSKMGMKIVCSTYFTGLLWETNNALEGYANISHS